MNSSSISAAIINVSWNSWNSLKLYHELTVNITEFLFVLRFNSGQKPVPSPRQASAGIAFRQSARLSQLAGGEQYYSLKSQHDLRSRFCRV